MNCMPDSMQEMRCLHTIGTIFNGSCQSTAKPELFLLSGPKMSSSFPR